jgi:hypothetical protein
VSELVASHGVDNGDPVQPWQLVVEQRDIRGLRANLLQRGTTLADLRHDLNLSARRKRPDNAFSVKGVVVGDHDPHFLLGGRHLANGTPLDVPNYQR